VSASGDSENYSAFVAFISLLSAEIDGLDDHYLSVHTRIDRMKVLLGPAKGPTPIEMVCVLDDIAAQLDVVGDAIAHCRRILMDAVTDPEFGA
jgi:hypothetical protein